MAEVVDIIHKLTYEADTDVITSLNKAFGNQFKQLQDLYAEQKKLDDLRAKDTQQGIAQQTALNAAYAKNKQQIDAITTSLGKELAANEKLNKSLQNSKTQFNSLSFSISNLLRDAPYGFIGIANNIGPAFDALIFKLNELKASGQSQTKIFSEIGNALFGLTGIINLAVIGFQLFGDQLFRSGEAASKAKDEYQKFLQTVRTNAQQAASSIDEQVFKLRTLVGVVRSDNASTETKRKALSELQKIYPNYLKNVTLEAVLQGKANDALANVEKGIESKEKANLASKTANALQADENRLTTERIALQKSLDAAQKRLDDARARNIGTAASENLLAQRKTELQKAQNDLDLNSAKIRENRLQVEESQRQAILNTIGGEDLIFSDNKTKGDPYKKALDAAEDNAQNQKLIDAALNALIADEIAINEKYVALYTSDIATNRLLTSEERAIRDGEYTTEQKRVNNLQEQRLNELGQSLQRQKVEIAKAFNNAGDIAKFENELNDLEIKQSELRLSKSQNADIIPPLTSPTGITPRKFNKVNTDAAEFDATAARKESERDSKNTLDKQVALYQQAANSIVSTFQQIYDARLAFLDAEIQITSARITAGTELAKRGNTEVLENELENLNRLQQERERVAERQLQINAALQASQAALVIVESLKTVTNAGATGDPYSTPIRIAAAVAALTAGFGAVYGLVNAFQGFADGGYTGDGGKYDAAGVVHKGEFVMTKEKTAMYRPLLEAMHEGRLKDVPMIGAGYATKTEVKGIERRLDQLIDVASMDSVSVRNMVRGGDLVTVTEKYKGRDKRRFS